MNTSELAAKIAEANDVTKAQVKRLIDAFLEEIVSEAATGGEVALPGFGKFKIKVIPEQERRSPRNGKKIKIAASRKLAFSPAKALEDTLNGVLRTST